MRGEGAKIGPALETGPAFGVMNDHTANLADLAAAALDRLASELRAAAAGDTMTRAAQERALAETRREAAGALHRLRGALAAETVGESWYAARVQHLALSGDDTVDAATARNMAKMWRAFAA